MKRGVVIMVIILLVLAVAGYMLVRNLGTQGGAGGLNEGNVDTSDIDAKSSENLITDSFTGETDDLDLGAIIE